MAYPEVAWWKGRRSYGCGWGRGSCPTARLTDESPQTSVARSSRSRRAAAPLIALGKPSSPWWATREAAHRPPELPLSGTGPSWRRWTAPEGS